MLRRTVTILALVAAGLTLGSGRAAACTLGNGSAVMLRASDFDPNVFVWDTRDRLVAYEGQLRWIPTGEVLRHAVLAWAGTRAVVVGCVANVVHPVVEHGVFDAILVRLTSGISDGRLGWVTGSDAHRWTPPRRI